MSHTLPQQVPFKLRQRPRRLAFLAVPLAIVSIGGTLIWALDDDSSPVSPQAVPADTSVGGPNESARGVAVASAAGAFEPTTVNGPDESARGQAVASATETGSVSVSGPDESARGQAVASATESGGGSSGPDEAARGQSVASAVTGK